MVQRRGTHRVTSVTGPARYVKARTAGDALLPASAKAYGRFKLPANAALLGWKRESESAALEIRRSSSGHFPRDRPLSTRKEDECKKGWNEEVVRG